MKSLQKTRLRKQTSINKKAIPYVSPRSRANPFAWHLINKKAFTIFDKKKK